jgi:hypothetical protein
MGLFCFRLICFIPSDTAFNLRMYHESKQRRCVTSNGTICIECSLNSSELGRNDAKASDKISADPEVRNAVAHEVDTIPIAMT